MRDPESNSRDDALGAVVDRWPPPAADDRAPAERPPTTTPPSAPIGLLAQIREDWIANDRDLGRTGLRAIVVHRLGRWRMRFRLRLIRAPLTLLHGLLFRRCRNIYSVELPWTVELGRRVVIEHQGCIVIHGLSVIGDDTTIRQGVTLGIRRVDQPGDAPVLGRGVDVGAGAKILGAVHVGDGAVIGANAVVLCDVPPGALAVGVPAKILDRRGGPRPVVTERGGASGSPRA